MKSNTTKIIPIALGLLLSACSTTSNQQSSTSIESNAAELTSAATATPPSNDSNAELIQSLQTQLDNNKTQLSKLNQSLDEKDRLIASLQKSAPSAETLATLEKQKQSRAELESQYSALKLDNELLRSRISQLENENVSLKQQVASLEAMPKSQDGFKQSYLELLGENTELLEKYANLQTDNKAYQKQLSDIKQENLILAGELSDARARHQALSDRIRSLSEGSVIPDSSTEPVTVNKDIAYERDNAKLRVELINLQNQLAEQKTLIEEYKNDIVKLEAALDEGAAYEQRWRDLNEKLSQAQRNNAMLAAQLEATELSLNTTKSELDDVSARLTSTEQALQINENSGISVTATIEALQSQLSSRLLNVRWQLPDEMALNNNFEILVSADVQPFLSGQTYQAELVVDSDIQMISDEVASAMVQNGRLQWRWRVAGLNEKPDAQLNLFVNQQINFQDQTIQRQIYRGSETLSLINTNLFDKYGYWVIAILLGLIGGFLVGRINKSKNIQDLNS